MPDESNDSRSGEFRPPTAEQIAQYERAERNKAAVNRDVVELAHAALAESLAQLAEILSDVGPDEDLAAVLQHLGSALRHIAPVERWLAEEADAVRHLEARSDASNGARTEYLVQALSIKFRWNEGDRQAAMPLIAEAIGGDR